ncbi:MAG: UDP-N-acetylmuramate--L-alanine ligase [Alphaproteobacteria bacterium]|nr:UDP-N-acetylmuramate--L-alanine ligase [Alphaproteobacteria bacterium]
MFRGKIRRIHFVGIGGIGMSGIAEVLLTDGFEVTGSDIKEGETIDRLRQLGAVVHIGHARENIGDSDVVVRSTAVDETNPEVAAAHEQGVPVIRRAEMLAELMRLKNGIAVAGTHGKTTTTSMLATCLAAAGLDPTVVIGGRLDNLGGTNARLGTGELLVAEADESDGTFLMLAPIISIVTNIDPEHLDHHKSIDALETAFVEFANRVPFYGFSVLCLDHPRVQRLIPQVRRPVVTYGYARQADYRCAAVETKGLTTKFTVYHHDERLGDVTLGMPGRHNVSNATAAIATAMHLDIPFATAAKALQGFTGVQRRFTVRAHVNDVLIVDDYGHHPVEIEATLEGADESFPERRIIAVFQPHRYTRVQNHRPEFCSAFTHADTVLVCPIYAAGEKPIEGLDHHALSQEMRERGHRGTQAVDSLDDAVDWLAANVKPGDLVITLGAGNVNAICARLAKRLAP